MQLPSQPPERNFLYYFSETQIALQVLTVQQGLFWPRKCFVKLFSFFLGRKPMKIWRFKLVQSQSFSYSVSTYSTRIERNICVPVCVWLWTCTIFDHYWQRSLPHSKGGNAQRGKAKIQITHLNLMQKKNKQRFAKRDEITHNVSTKIQITEITLWIWIRCSDSELGSVLDFTQAASGLLSKYSKFQVYCKFNIDVHYI